jgi:GH25 family lysozyme M1 (1,4-beta-N-acetylmuramidase)
MADELKAILSAQMAQDDNIQAVGVGAGGKTVLFVLDDAPKKMAAYAVAAPDVEIVRCNGFGIGPPYWTAQETEPLAYKQRMRPVPGGVSVAHERVTAGTVSGYVIDNLTGELCLLSNHHVLVSPMDGGPVGANIVQPGPADGGVAPGDVVARLVRWVNIRQENISRFVDCAIAKPVDASLIDQNIIALGYPHGVLEPWIGQELIKSGRTSETTRGQCVVIEADVKVNYGDFSRTIQRCIITGVPSEPGDSGAMMMDKASHDAVALLFAGGSLSDGTRITVGCRMDLVEELLNVTVPPPPVAQREFWLDLSHWQGDIQSLADDMTGNFKASTDGLTPYSFSQMVVHGVDGVVLKAAQGKDIIDPNFADYYDRARAVGLQVAAYDYVDPRYSAIEHFTNWRQAVGEREFAFVAMDCEAASGQTIQRISAVIQQFGELLSLQYDRLPWIYTSVGFWNQYVLPWSGWSDYPLWIAFWSRIAKWPLLPEAWKNVEGQPKMWQFMVSDFGQELGVGSKQVDMNTMFQSGIELIGAEPSQPPVSFSVSPSSSPSPSAGGPAEFTHNKGVVIAPRGVNIRSGPGVTYADIGDVPFNAVVEILGTAKDRYGNDWVRIGFSQWSAKLYQGQEFIRYVV